MLRKIHRSASSSDLIIQTLRELNRHYSRLELASSNLHKRDKELFEICKSCLEKRQKERATIYANEIAEVRKTIVFVANTKMSLEKVIARLETIKEICPTVNELKGLFGDVKNVLKLLSETMPAIDPQMDALNNLVSEILGTTQTSSAPSIEPIIVKDASTEAILREAAGTVEEEIMKRMPEPPTAVTSHSGAEKQMIALTATGDEMCSSVREDQPVMNRIRQQPDPKDSTCLTEELVLDYIYRHKNEMNLAQCAEEIALPQNEILNILDALNSKGKIRIER